MKAVKLLGLVGALAPLAATACLNDRDTLAYELRNKPDVKNALTGRFDRFPKLYYQMRVDRLEKQGKLTPEEVDDLAVAYERLGNSKKAMQVIDRKLKMPTSKMRQYSYYANHGTFLAHDWLRSGAKKENIAEMKQAAKEISKALEINPQAHSGREGAQLDVMLGIIQMKEHGEPELTVSFTHSDDPVKGLAGLIMLGAGWESPDVVGQIINMAEPSFPGTSLLAAERYKELVANGKKSMGHYDLRKNDLDHPEGEPSIVESFKRLRRYGDEWVKSRNDFALAKLSKGEHPDTNPDFWKGWQEPKAPALVEKPRTLMNPSFQTRMLFGWVGAALLMVGSVVTFYIVQKKKSRNM